jgi:hypothetical protein
MSLKVCKLPIGGHYLLVYCAGELGVYLPVCTLQFGDDY